MNQSAARRLLLLLEHLAGRPQGAPLTDICVALELPKSIGHRLLSLLVEAGYVAQRAEAGHYALTLKLTMLGQRHYVSTGLDDLAQPVLERLAAETGELARLAVVEGHRLVWVAKAQGARAGLRYDPPRDQDTGHDVVLHATATGKAWLATLPTEQALQIVKAAGLRTPARFGPNAARSIAQFKARLAVAVRNGYGEAIEEGEPGTAAVAVAVHGEPSRSGPSVATISVAGPVVRFSAERRARFAELLQRAAIELGQIWPLRACTITGANQIAPRAGTKARKDGHREREHRASL